MILSFVRGQHDTVAPVIPAGRFARMTRVRLATAAARGSLYGPPVRDAWRRSTPSDGSPRAITSSNRVEKPEISTQQRHRSSTPCEKTGFPPLVLSLGERLQ